jgi:NADH:ubiquinone oxidoreductase subunit C
MAREEEMGQELIKNFDFLDGKIRVPRERRIFIDDVPVNKFEEVLEFLKNKIYFNMLCTITGLDDGNTLGIIYHLANKEGIVINIKIRVPKDKPKIKTIIEYFPSAEFYERELVDLFGIEVEGLPEGTRYPLPDDWPDGQYPLRKDWKSDVLKKESE